MPLLTRIISNEGGVCRGSRLAEYGFSRRMLSSAVARGEISRVRSGVFAVQSASDDIVTAAAHGGALTCARALRLHGVWSLHEDAHPHVWLGRSGRAHHHAACRCAVHYFAGRAPLGLAPIDDILVHTYHCGGDEAFFVALESALRTRSLTEFARRGIRSRLPVGARWLLDLARSDADSGLESILRLRLHLLRIDLDCQVEIPTVGRVDFVIGGRLILEADGAEHHDGAINRHRDLRRDAAASALGYETLRFDYALIVHDWTVVESAIIAALARVAARA